MLLLINLCTDADAMNPFFHAWLLQTEAFSNGPRQRLLRACMAVASLPTSEAKV